MPPKDGPSPMDVNKARIQTRIHCYHCHQSGHLARNCPHAFDVWTMTPGERLGLLPELLALAEATETLSPSTDFERLADEVLEEGLIIKKLSKENFGDRSG